MNKSTFGQLLREARQKKGLTQIALAEGICTPSMICQIEKGNTLPSISMTKELAARLQQPLENFYWGYVASRELASFYHIQAMIEDDRFEQALLLLHSLPKDRSRKIPLKDYKVALATCQAAVGSVEEARTIYEDLFEHALLCDDIELKMHALQGQASVAERECNYTLAVHFLKKVHRFASTVEGASFWKLRAANKMAELLLEMGQAEQALPYLEDADREREHLRNPADLASLYVKLSHAHRETQDGQKAAEYADRATSLLHVLQRQEQVLEVKRTYAALLRESGALEEAQGLLDECLAACTSHTSANELAKLEAEVARVCADKGELEQAMTHVEAALANLSPDSLETARCQFLLAELSYRMGDRKTASLHLRPAVKRFANTGQVEEMLKAMKLADKMFDERMLDLPESQAALSA